LKNSIYGLVQAVYQWWKKFESEMAKIDFVNNQADPCIVLKFWNGMKYILALYVDDCIVAGDEKLIEDTICRLKKVLTSRYKETWRTTLDARLKEAIKSFVLVRNESFKK
jgi:hypothetical protein